MIKLAPLFEKTFRKHKLLVNKNWRIDETYIKIKGEWRYLYRAVDKAEKTIDFLAANASRRSYSAALLREIGQNGAPETVTVAKSGVNLAALKAINAERETPIRIGQNKYLNNLVEQDHRPIKRIIKSDTDKIKNATRRWRFR